MRKEDYNLRSRRHLVSGQMGKKIRLTSNRESEKRRRNEVSKLRGTKYTKVMQLAPELPIPPEDWE